MLLLSISVVGSSPCLRGTQKEWIEWAQLRRFIPVLTGNTSILATNFNRTAVHPRAYGEHQGQARPKTSRYGSSPCLRGTHISSNWRAGTVRFIPVLTGNTNPDQTPAGPSSVHPRAYGEHAFVSWPDNGATGSSPCLRGTPRSSLSLQVSIRFIPVLTGNTPVRSYSEVSPGGSSPCLRGTLPIPTYCRSTWRFIPVLTGNTQEQWYVVAPHTVHPRAYGEHLFTSRSHSTSRGSSPCLRGTPLPAPH